jgi:diguanylate cyclase (GGDEF)-like protein
VSYAHLMWRRKSTSSGPSGVDFPITRLKEGLQHSLRIIGRVHPNQRIQDMIARIVSDVQRATTADDLEEIALDLSTIPMPESKSLIEPEINAQDMMAHCIDAALPLASAIEIPGITEGLLDLRAKLPELPVDEKIPRRFATQLIVLTGAVQWLRRMAEVFRVSLSDMVDVLEPLATGEDEAHGRLVRLRDRLEQADDSEELQTLRGRLVQEASFLVEEATRRKGVSSDIQVNIEAHRAQILLLESALVDAQVMSKTDPLTGLGNRIAMDERTAEAARKRTASGVLMIDIDHFKLVNDTHGHNVGDAVIYEVARRIRGELRGNDYAFRIGGEEFVALLAGTDLAGTRATAERIRLAIADSILQPGKLNLQITVSVGCALWSGGATFPDILRSADEALYKAKSGGRNLVMTAR